MDFFIVIVSAAAAAYWFFRLQERRRKGELLEQSFGREVHPKTVAAMVKEGAKGELEQDGQWAKENVRELAERFPGQWIAVVRKEVVAISRDPDEAWTAARSSRPERAPFVMRLS